MTAPLATARAQARAVGGRAAPFLIAAFGCVACAQLPTRDPRPAAVPRAAVADNVTVRGAQGPLSDAAEGRVLRAVQAEGRGDLVAHHLSLLAARGDADLYRGNSTRLLVDGPATFAAMKASIAQASMRVLLESYIFEDEGIASEFAQLLKERVAKGVAVAIIYDGIGSFGADPAFFDSMRQSGVAVCQFNPVNPFTRPGYWGIQQRDHRKVLVVDSAVAYTGGINISQVYASGSFGRSGSARSDADKLKNGWRDTQVELRGPAVQPFADAFGKTWQAQGCQGVLPDVPAPAAGDRSPGTRVVQVLAGDPKEGDSRIYRAMLGAIDGAVQSVHLTMAYFAPGPDMVKALCDAARRGVDVSLVLPARSDFPLILHAGRSYYQQMLDAGVHIHEMERAVLHAKTAVIDGVFSTIGSSNLDWRSFVDNNEINAIVLGDDFGQETEALFQRDVAAAVKVEPAEWKKRGIGPRFMELIGRVTERWL